MNTFRPQQYNKQRRLVWWREFREYVGDLNWKTNYTVKIFKQQKWTRVYKIGQHLHYLACHAPQSVNKKYYQAWCRFYKKYRKF